MTPTSLSITRRFAHRILDTVDSHMRASMVTLYVHAPHAPVLYFMNNLAHQGRHTCGPQARASMSTAGDFPTPRTDTDEDSECTFAPNPTNGPGPVYPSAKLAACCSSSTTGITASLFGKDTGRTYTRFVTLTLPPRSCVPGNCTVSWHCVRSVTILIRGRTITSRPFPSAQRKETERKVALDGDIMSVP